MWWSSRPPATKASSRSPTRRALPAVISVGATTRDRCLADYSNGGSRLDLVAPGGGDDSPSLSDPDCHPDRRCPNIYQMTFFNPSQPDQFGYPADVYGTSMSTPEVAATAALMIASGVIGPHPTPDQILARLEQTASRWGPAGRIPTTATAWSTRPRRPHRSRPRRTAMSSGRSLPAW